MLTRSEIEQLVQAVHRDVAANKVGVVARSPRHVERLRVLQSRHAAEAEAGRGGEGGRPAARFPVPS